MTDISDEADDGLQPPVNTPVVVTLQAQQPTPIPLALRGSYLGTSDDDKENIKPVDIANESAENNGGDDSDN